MKKTTLLIIGACAFVLQSAIAQQNLFYDDFTIQTEGATPISTPSYPAYAGTGTDGSPNIEWGGYMWTWVGEGGDPNNVGPQSTFMIQSVLSSDGMGSTLAAVLSWTAEGANNWFGWEEAPHCSLVAAPANALSDLTLSFDVAVSGNGIPNETDPIGIWFDQFPLTVKTFDAVYQPDLSDPVNGWVHVSFTLDELVPSGTSGAYDPNLGFEIAVTGGGLTDPGTMGQIAITDMVLTEAVPEPGTIALLTLGGLSALVAIRRRR